MRWAIAASVAFGVLAWWALARAMGPLLLPTPGAVFVALVEHRGTLAAATVQTALAAGMGLFAATFLGLLVAGLSWWSRLLRVALLPYTVLVQVVPIVAIAPLLVVWLGYGGGVSSTTAAIAAFFPVFAATEAGLAAPAVEWVDLFRLLGASRLRELVSLRAQAALPSIFAGLRTAAGLAVIGAIVGEFIGSNGSPPSLGYTVLFASRSAHADQAFSAIAMAALLALALGGAIRLVEHQLVGRWHGA